MKKTDSEFVMGPAPEAPAKKRPALDPELQAMAKIDRLLAELPSDAAAGRVLAWALHRRVPGMVLHVTDKEPVVAGS